MKNLNRRSRKWVDTQKRIAQMQDQLKQMKASGKSTSALEKKIEKINRQNMVRYAQYGPND